MGDRRKPAYEVVERLGIHIPILLFVAPAVAFAVGIWAWTHFYWTVFTCILLIVIVPILVYGVAFGVSPQLIVRNSVHPIPFLSAFVGICIVPFLFVVPTALTGPDPRRVRVERILATIESSGDLPLVNSSVDPLSLAEIRTASIKDQQRMAIQLARANKWGLAHEVWSATVVSGFQENEMRASSYFEMVRKNGVRKDVLAGLCTNLAASGYRQQAEMLWMEHYPDIPTSSWR